MDMFPRVISISIAIAVVASTRTHSAEEATTPPLPQPIQRPRAPASEMVDLGRDLFLDPRLSRTEKISCASCHQPDKGFSNGERFGVGVDSRVGSRNVPGLVNIALSNTFFWDGRAATLQEQALGPIEHPDEMDMRPAALAAKLNRMEAYRKRFEAVFGGGATPERIGRAIAAFETTLVVDDTPFDRFLSGDRNAL